jgi:hypothetical protein
MKLKLSVQVKSCDVDHTDIIFTLEGTLKRSTDLVYVGITRIQILIGRTGGQIMIRIVLNSGANSVDDLMEMLKFRS